MKQQENECCRVTNRGRGSRMKSFLIAAVALFFIGSSSARGPVLDNIAGSSLPPRS